MWQCRHVARARSKITAQRQISPVTFIEGSECGDEVVVRRAGTYTSEDIHQTLFLDGKGEAHSIEEMDEGIRRHLRAKYARG